MTRIGRPLGYYSPPADFGRAPQQLARTGLFEPEWRRFTDTKALAPSDQFPISGMKALGLASGVATGFRARVPSRYFSQLHQIRDLRDTVVAKSDEELRQAFDALRNRRRAGESREALLPETFAIVREVSRRQLGLEHYEVQLLGGMALTDGAVAELKTGEGKTIAAALAASLFALDGRGCHVATTNPYLASRDAETLRPVYEALGLTVGVTLTTDQTEEKKKAAYRCDITYGEAETFAFDWLNDQLVLEPEMRLQRELATAIVDEADDVLLDAAQMPLILAGDPRPSEEMREKKKLFELADKLARALDPKTHIGVDFEDGTKQPYLTEEGIDFIEAQLSEDVWSRGEADLLGAVLQAVHAHYGFDLDNEYIGDTQHITLVNDATGHPLPKSRWTDGLMEAVQTKEGHAPDTDQVQLGQVTFQNYFRNYEHLSGMTGTAKDGLEELREIYGLRVIEVPTHEPVRRIDEPDVFLPHPALQRMEALADAIEHSEKGQPILIATTTVKASKVLSARMSQPALLFIDALESTPRLLDESVALVGATDRDDLLRKIENESAAREAVADFLEESGLHARPFLSYFEDGLPHCLLNAETLDQEAEIVARAGQQGAITVSTQVAGRGVDIPLGKGVEDLGGLRMIGLGHQTNARKDEQVKGRAGRQGKPGSSRFYISPSDLLFTYLPASEIRDLCKASAVNHIEDLSSSAMHRWTKAVRRAQTGSEARSREQRKKNTEFDAIVQKQRNALNEMKKVVLEAEDPEGLMHSWLDEDAAGLQANLEKLRKELLTRPFMSDERVRGIFRRIILRALNQAWVEYQSSVEDIRTSAQLKTAAQKNPYVEFTTDSAKIFIALFSTLEKELAKEQRSAYEALLAA